ncbi:hypothetical protein QQS21_007885 [Conoideocrella luteorostrata]|uniref:Uncharacterized protein n=1 Tax=Conoideocrella luteorostrata TaxID=1105319 RepID=A0AAJ0CMK8_9HYPO|nr:hypothetical protein QQS21_007885 [Conoideocrella luteorostrata]
MTKFTFNCTLALELVTFVSAPDTRGTLDIVWGCLTILFICTWSVVHLNVPPQSTPANKARRYGRSSFRAYWNILWLLVNVLAPEWALGKAWSDYRSVASTKSVFDEMSKKDMVPWTKKHIFSANMGGFTIKFNEATATEDPHRPIATENETSQTPASPSTDDIRALDVATEA